MANDIQVLFQYETENIDQVEICAKNYMKKSQYRKYKEVYQVDLNILRKIIVDCDKKIIAFNDEIEKYNKKIKKKLKAGSNQLQPTISADDKIYMLIPKID